MIMTFIMRHLHQQKTLGGIGKTNLHFKYNKSFIHLIYLLAIYIRSLNYQWEIDDYATPYYHPGRDVDNFHLSLKLTYLVVVNFGKLLNIVEINLIIFLEMYSYCFS